MFQHKSESFELHTKSIAKSLQQVYEYFEQPVHEYFDILFCERGKSE